MAKEKEIKEETIVEKVKEKDINTHSTNNENQTNTNDNAKTDDVGNEENKKNPEKQESGTLTSNDESKEINNNENDKTKKHKIFNAEKTDVPEEQISPFFAKRHGNYTGEYANTDEERPDAFEEGNPFINFIKSAFTIIGSVFLSVCNLAGSAFRSLVFGDSKPIDINKAMENSNTKKQIKEQVKKSQDERRKEREEYNKDERQKDTKNEHKEKDTTKEKSKDDQVNEKETKTQKPKPDKNQEKEETKAKNEKSNDDKTKENEEKRKEDVKVSIPKLFKSKANKSILRNFDLYVDNGDLMAKGLIDSVEIKGSEKDFVPKIANLFEKQQEKYKMEPSKTDATIKASLLLTSLKLNDKVMRLNNILAKCEINDKTLTFENNSQVQVAVKYDGKRIFNLNKEDLTKDKIETKKIVNILSKEIKNFEKPERELSPNEKKLIEMERTQQEEKIYQETGENINDIMDKVSANDIAKAVENGENIDSTLENMNIEEDTMEYESEEVKNFDFDALAKSMMSGGEPVDPEKISEADLFGDTNAPIQDEEEYEL